MNTVKSIINRAFFKEPSLNSYQIRRYCEAEWGPNAEYVYSMMTKGASLDEIRKGLK
jgi:hypothetical protein